MTLFRRDSPQLWAPRRWHLYRAAWGYAAVRRLHRFTKCFVSGDWAGRMARDGNLVGLAGYLDELENTHTGDCLHHSCAGPRGRKRVAAPTRPVSPGYRAFARASILPASYGRLRHAVGRQSIVTLMLGWCLSLDRTSTQLRRVRHRGNAMMASLGAATTQEPSSTSVQVATRSYSPCV